MSSNPGAPVDGPVLALLDFMETYLSENDGLCAALL